MRVLLILVFISLANITLAQDTIPDNIPALEQKIESIAEFIDNEDADYSQLAEQLNYFKQHPLQLNHSTITELEQLLFLSDFQIASLLSHIADNGKLLSILELQSVRGFDIETIRNIAPFVTVGISNESTSFTFNEMLRQGRSYVITRYSRIVEDQKGFTSPGYLGSPTKLYASYSFNYNNKVSWAIRAEKDAGEEFFKGTQKRGFDFYSANFYFRNKGFIRSLAIGDYAIGFGQGMVGWSALSFSKTSDATSIKKYTMGIRPSASVEENAFMRGLGITLGWKMLELTLFVSRHRVDANVTDTLPDGEARTVSSLQQSGLHTTGAEIADRHSIRQLIAGANISYKKKQFSAGITGMHTSLSASLQRELRLYNRSVFSAKELSNAAVDFHFLFRNIDFFGEAAISDNKGYAFINGVIVSMAPGVTLVASYRNYRENYQSLSASPFAEGNGAANEQGIYLATALKLSPLVSINAYCDQFYFPWLKYQVDGPSRGNEYMVHTDYSPTKKTGMYFRYRQINKNKNASSEAIIDQVMPTLQRNYRYHVFFQATKEIKLQNRVELINYQGPGGEKENGYLVYQDVAYRKPGSWLSFSIRYALFDTKSFYSRLYAYEADMPGVFSIPSYFYKGSRAFMLLHFFLPRKTELWIRVSQTFYSNRNVISEGTLNEIDGNTKTEFKAQLRIQF